MIDFYLQRHESYLKQLMTAASIPASRINTAINYALFPGGKRIRPILVYLTGEILAVRVEILDVIAAAIELTHCYSLVHDDLPAMDDDDYRRGRLSCHKAFDEATAILVGDGMQALAIETLLTGLMPLVSATTILTIIQELVQASGVSGMVSGQSLDLSELCKQDLDEQKLNQIHVLKTGRLINSCFTMVTAACEQITPIKKQALEQFSYHMGLVFQIQDDYLDFYAPKNVLGKERSSDQANGKTTFATLFSRVKLEEKIDFHYQQAFAQLEQFGTKAEQLKQLAEDLQRRSRLTD